MKHSLLLLLFVIVASCSNASNVEPGFTQTSSSKSTADVILATSTPFPKSTSLPTFTQTAVPTATQTPLPPCEPLQEEYCVYPYAGILQPPFYAPDQYYLNQFYNYGSTDFGARMPHHGVDFDNPTGAQVYASADGEVVYAGNDHDRHFSPWPDFYGNLIILKHTGDGVSFYTFYAHLSKIQVQEGDVVSAGEPIGKVGSSGVAIGPHLHLEVRQSGNIYTQTQNPELWLAPYETNGFRSGYLAARVLNRQGQLNHVDLTIEFFNFNDGTAPAVWKASYETYLFDKYPVGQDDHWQENFAQGGLWPGYYKITALKNGREYERWVEILPEHLTYFIMIVD